MNPIARDELVRHQERALREAAETARRLADGHRGRGRHTEASPPRRPVRKSR
jgi:hypothetical protein